MTGRKVVPVTEFWLPAEPCRVREVHLVRALCAFRQSERRWHPFAGGAPLHLIAPLRREMSCGWLARA